MLGMPNVGWNILQTLKEAKTIILCSDWYSTFWVWCSFCPYIWHVGTRFQLTYWQPVCRTIWNDFLFNKGGKLCNVITYVIWATKKTESLVYRWLHAHAIFDVTGFLAFVRASDVVSSIMLITCRVKRLVKPWTFFRLTDIQDTGMTS